MNKLDKFNQDQLEKLSSSGKKIPELRAGQTVRVHQRIKEGDKQRIQIFEGLVIARKHGRGINSTITVRKISHGVGVERIFPVHSPVIEKIEIVKQGKTRRAKLYYIRHKSAKEARLKDITEKAVKKSTPKKPAPQKKEAASKPEKTVSLKKKTETKKEEKPQENDKK